MVNLHFSLLPRWRGAAPVERAILAGDERTGVCLMAVEEGLDTGGDLRRGGAGDRPRRDRSTSSAAGWSSVGTALLVDTLARGLGEPAPQEGEPTYADKIEPDELRARLGPAAVELHRRRAGRRRVDDPPRAGG